MLIDSAALRGITIRKLLTWRAGLIATGVLLFVGALWRLSPYLLRLLQDQQALEQLVQQLGWFGPLAFVIFNMLQIIIAPIPGYLIQAAAGFLYGALWGGVWASCGLIGGALVAMMLARRFGRPLVAKLVGEDRLARWSHVTRSDHPLIWFLLLLAPIGDSVYFLAGLSEARYLHMALLTFVVRVPTVFFTAAVGAGALALSWTQLALIYGALAVILLLFLRHQQQLLGWISATVDRQIEIREK
jgi:uncharacterized membrane protein YdjX (TVP38/TMEM64 family)